MILFHYPTDNEIAKWRKCGSELSLSYTQHGASLNGDVPTGFIREHRRILLGSGEHTYNAAKEAVHSWQLFRMRSLSFFPPPGAPKVGDISVMLLQFCGVVSLNMCRVIYLIDDDLSAVKRSGFGYGTTTCHAECGEERFLIEWDRASDQVFYDLFSFSRPHYWWVYAGYPWARYLQKHCADLSLLFVKEQVERCCR